MISIVIPVINEAVTIVSLFDHIYKNSTLKNISEIIVVDGGSEDETCKTIDLYAKSSPLNIRLMASEKGRAKQMNIGGCSATASILYFLHADSLPPSRYDTLILKEVQKGNKAGCFRMQFDCNHWWLRLASWLTQFSWRACRGGDQSQFITRELFHEIGGYDERFIIYEDNILINELYARNEFVVIQSKIRTSARLYKKHGIWKLQYHFWTIYVKKWFGATADELFAYYKKYLY